MINFLNFIMLMPPSEDGSQKLEWVLMLAMVIVVFYFFMIRPQMKRQKELRNFRESLAKGDKVVTNGGIYGKITAINENIISLEISKDVVIKIDKSAVLKDPADLQQQQQK
jgi:preprotein translocase subunit YajC